MSQNPSAICPRLYYPVSEECWGGFGRRPDTSSAQAPIFTTLSAARAWLATNPTRPRLDGDVAEFELDHTGAWAHVAWHRGATVEPAE